MSEEKKEEEFNGLSFSEEIEVVPVRIKGKDGKVRNYTLKEFGTDGLTAWMNTLGENARAERDGRKADFSKHHAKLICLCLYDEHDQPVPRDEIASWKASIQFDLFRVVQRINALNEAGQEAAKKT